MAADKKRPHPKAEQAAGHRRPEGLHLVALDPERYRAPALPSDYHPAARKAWAEYWTSPVAVSVDARSDVSALETWAWAKSEWHELIEEQAGAAHLATLKYLTGIIQRAEIEFGMTPLARARLGVTVGQAKLTAQELNKRLEREAKEQAHDPLLDEWEEA